MTVSPLKMAAPPRHPHPPLPRQAGRRENEIPPSHSLRKRWPGAPPQGCVGGKEGGCSHRSWGSWNPTLPPLPQSSYPFRDLPKAKN